MSEIVLKILEALAPPVFDYFGFKTQAFRESAKELKISLVKNIEDYQSPDTTLSVLVLSTFPSHNKAFNRFLVQQPKRKRPLYREKWKPYEEVYNFFNIDGKSLKGFGIVAAEVLHPDIVTTENDLYEIERKRKIQILNSLNYFLDI